MIESYNIAKNMTTHAVNINLYFVTIKSLLLLYLYTIYYVQCNVSSKNYYYNISSLYCT